MKLTDLSTDSLGWVRYIVGLQLSVEWEKSYINSSSIKNPNNIIKTTKRIEELNKAIDDVWKFHPEISQEHINEFYQKYSSVMRTNEQRMYYK